MQVAAHIDCAVKTVTVVNVGLARVFSMVDVGAV